MGLIIGFDPGINGSAAALCPADADGPEFIADAIDLPTMPDGSKRQIDDFALERWLRRLGRVSHAVIENVRAMPSIPDEDGERRSMGSASAFRFGMAAGQLRATVRMVLQIEPEFVEPAVWKRYFALSSDKEESRRLALRLFPHSAYLLTRKKDHQRAEAMLVAKWRARPLIGRGW